jgi:hypothetical protein
MKIDIKEIINFKLLFFLLSFSFVYLAFKLDSFYFRIVSLFFFLFFYYKYSIKDNKNGFLKSYFTNWSMFFIITIFSLSYVILIYNNKIGIFIMMFLLVVFGILTLIVSILNLYKEKNKFHFIILYIITMVVIVYFFAFFYANLSVIDGNNLVNRNKEVTSSIDFIYYSGVVFYSVGFGDILPVGNFMKILTLIEAGLNFFLHVIVIGWVLNKLKN